MTAKAQKHKERFENVGSDHLQIKHTFVICSSDSFEYSIYE